MKTKHIFKNLDELIDDINNNDYNKISLFIKEKETDKITHKLFHVAKINKKQESDRIGLQTYHIKNINTLLGTSYIYNIENNECYREVEDGLYKYYIVE